MVWTVYQVFQALMVLLGHRALQVFRGHRDCREPVVQTGRTGHLATQDLTASTGQRVLMALLVCPV
jgi:hypothetical protein